MTQTDTAAPMAMARRTFAFSRQEVFDAWLDEDAVSQFMCPRPGTVTHASIDARVGGSYRIDMTIGGEPVARYPRRRPSPPRT